MRPCILAFLIVSLSHCIPFEFGADGPDAVLAAFARHLKAGENEEAWKLLSEGARREMRPEDLADQALPSGTEEGTRIEWKKAESGAGVVVLVRERGAWRVEAILAEAPTSTFASALSSFLSAIERGDCGTLLRFTPPKVLSRQPKKVFMRGCEREIGHLRRSAALVRAAGAQPVLVGEDRAVLSYGKGRKLILVRIGRRWYVEDL